ncbi:MAG: ornithine carbamoyltransferase, catabolic [Isosphaeraceae bacterium]|jgi:ornithine carbamoyltransferase|nr:MAG: ornithine carbamoyltransferase, catabolic [Isosphaeraceae bacterium]
MLRHFLDLFDLTPSEAQSLLKQALDLKARSTGGQAAALLRGKTLGLLFEKPSLRTRVSFEAAVQQLGGSAIFLQAQEVGLGVRESIPDIARVLSQYLHALAVRSFSQSTIDQLAQHATIPVINALSDSAHPCQAMADLMTIREVVGRTQGVRIVFVGDGNNVARSLAVAAALLGAHLTLCGPPAYHFPAEFVDRFVQTFPDSPLEQTDDPAAALADADVVYTDVWTSMGQEQEAATRRAVFEPFRVDEALMARARPSAIFLHCLPAHRGEEVSDAVLDGPRSRVVPQAANRLHFQKALLLWLMDRPAVRLPRRSTTPIPRRRKRTG